MGKLRPKKEETKDVKAALKEARSSSRGKVESVNNAVTRLIENVLALGINGRGRFASAEMFAKKATKHTGSDDEATDRIIRQHVRRARVGGFASGLGGFVTMAFTLPANVLSFYAMAARMVASIAEVRGYDTDDEQVRSAVLVALTGTRSEKVMEQVGLGPITGRLASSATKRLPDATLLILNKAVGVTLLRTVGTRGLTRLFRWVPLLGGLVGQWADARMMRRIAKTADTHFPQKA